MAEPSTDSEIAPGGRLRVGMIAVGVVRDVGTPIAQFIADKLQAIFEPVVYSTSPAFGQSVGTGAWDLAIGSRVFATTDTAEIPGNLYAVELIFVVVPGVPIASAADVDAAGVRIGVVEGSPSDKFISRTMTKAQVVRYGLTPKVGEAGAELMRSGEIDVLGADAGICHEAAVHLAGARILPGAFETVPIAVLLPKGLSRAAQDRIRQIMDEVKVTGIVQRAIDQSGHKGLRVTPD